MTMKGSVSSKRKSSKKRNHKISSSSKKKKSKGKELQKRRHDSVSSFSREDSVNSDCSSSSVSDYRRKVKKTKRRRPRDYSISSCSDDDHSSDSMPRRDSIRKSKKLGRTKSDSKRKTARKRYSSPESDGEARHVRKTKRKRSTGDRDGKRKKKSSTKKSKRDLSPDSLSCSTSPSKSSSSTVDGKSKRSKQIHMEKEITRDKDREVSSPYMPSPVNNSTRLRSVINVVYRRDEDDRWDGNFRDEDMLHELDNYPSPISLDGYDEGGKRKFDNHDESGISNKRLKLEDVTAEAETRLGNSEIYVDSRAKKIEGKETNVAVPSPVAALEGDNNIELILRQKALENLRKFKAGRLQTAPQCTVNVKANDKNDGPNQPSKQATIHRTELTNQKSGVTFEKDSSPEVKKLSKPDGVVVEEESGTVKQSHIVSVSTSGNNKPGTLVTQSSNTEPISSAKPIPGHLTVDEDRDEGKDAPEFEQKTMSVMRGGEMVQVSYKVKIPKRALALARRQLRR